jgi:hypothetical protein
MTVPMKSLIYDTHDSARHRPHTLSTLTLNVVYSIYVQISFFFFFYLYINNGIIKNYYCMYNKIEENIKRI